MQFSDFVFKIVNRDYNTVYFLAIIFLCICHCPKFILFTVSALYFNRPWSSDWQHKPGEYRSRAGTKHRLYHRRPWRRCWEDLCPSYLRHWWCPQGEAWHGFLMCKVWINTYRFCSQLGYANKIFPSHFVKITLSLSVSFETSKNSTICRWLLLCQKS